MYYVSKISYFAISRNFYSYKPIAMKFQIWHTISYPLCSFQNAISRTILCYTRARSFHRPSLSTVTSYRVKISNWHGASRGPSATTEPAVYLSCDLLEVLQPGVTTEVDGRQRGRVDSGKQPRHQQRVDHHQRQHLHVSTSTLRGDRQWQRHLA